MAVDELLIRRDGGVVIATLNRPEKLNALSRDIFEALNRLVEILGTDKTARVLILTGSGEKSFSVGADLKERSQMNEKDILVRFDYVRQLYEKIERLPQSVIAAINGTALGGGLELAMVCDLRVSVETAVLGFPEVGLAIIPGNGGTQRLARWVGLGKAMELILTTKRINAKEAMNYGLINTVVGQGQALSEAIRLAKQLEELAPLALKQAKAAVRASLDVTLAEGLMIETECYKGTLYSKDRLEGLKSFQEKRKPVYRGE